MRAGYIVTKALHPKFDKNRKAVSAVFRIAFAHFYRGRATSFVAALAALVVVASVTSSYAIKTAAIERPLNYLRMTGTDVWVAIPGTYDYASNSIMSADDVKKIQQAPGVTDAQGTLYLFTSAEKGDKRSSVTIQTTEALKPYGGAWQLSEGQQFSKDGEVVLDETLKGDLGINLGDSVKLGNNKFKVVGIASGVAAIGKQMVFMTTHDVQTKFIGAPVVTHVQAKSSDPAKSVVAIKQLGYAAYTSPEWVELNRDYWTRQVAAPLDSLATIAILLGALMVLVVMLLTGWMARRQLAISKVRGRTTSFLAGVVLTKTYLAEIVGFVLAVPVALLFIGTSNAGSPGLEAVLSLGDVATASVIVLVASLLAIIPSLVSIHKVDPTLILQEA